MAKRKYYQRPDGLFETSRTLPNGKRKMFRGRTCKEVDQKILAYTEEQEQGRPFKAIAEEWWEQLLETAKPSTANAYRASYKDAIDYFGETKIRTICKMDTQKYISTIAKKGFGYGAVHVRVTVLSLIFKHAEIQGDTDHNPARGISIPKGLEKGVRAAPNASQDKIIIDADDDSTETLMAKMLLYTGLRIGELMALDWQDIDREAKRIHVTKKVNYSGSSAGRLETFLKSERGLRDVVLLDDLANYLPKDRIGRIFVCEDGRPFPKCRYVKAWQTFCEAHGLLNEDGKPALVVHQLRHSFATICREAGVGIDVCARWMGDTEKVVSEIYQDVRPEREEQAADQLNEHLKRA